MRALNAQTLGCGIGALLFVIPYPSEIIFGHARLQVRIALLQNVYL